MENEFSYDKQNWENENWVEWNLNNVKNYYLNGIQKSLDNKTLTFSKEFNFVLCCRVQESVGKNLNENGSYTNLPLSYQKRVSATLPK